MRQYRQRRQIAASRIRIRDPTQTSVVNKNRAGRELHDCPRSCVGQSAITPSRTPCKAGRLREDLRMGRHPNFICVLNILAPRSLWFLYGLRRHFAGTPPLAGHATTAMQSLRPTDFDQLDAALQSAPALSTSLFCKVLQVCARFESIRQLGRAKALDELVEASAWTDATLHLLELELPNWTIRRLVHDGDDWLCTLSRRPSVPIALDDCVEAVHAMLPLAIMRALVEARRRLSTAGRPALRIPEIRAASGITMCCDNFV